MSGRSIEQKPNHGAAMEISPIPGIRAVPAVKPSKNNPQLSAVFDIENVSGPQQDTFSNNGKKMAGGQDGETTEQEVESAEPSADTPDSNTGSTVNLIA
jgi:hypothetical protein